MANTYNVNGTGFDSYFAAIKFAQAAGAEVIETATGARRWFPAPVSNKKRVRHVIVNADGSLTPFSKVSR